MKKRKRPLLILLTLLICISTLPFPTAQAIKAWTPYGRGAGHATASGDSVSFWGHPTDPFVALLFRPANDGDYRTLTFHLSEGVSDWHTIESNGFIWNAGISNNTLSGDAVMFGQNSVGFYKLTNVPLSNLSSAQFTRCSGVTLVESIGNAFHNMQFRDLREEAIMLRDEWRTKRNVRKQTGLNRRETLRTRLKEAYSGIKLIRILWVFIIGSVIGYVAVARMPAHSP